MKMESNIEVAINSTKGQKEKKFYFFDANNGDYHGKGEDKNRSKLSEFKMKLREEIQDVDFLCIDAISSMEGAKDNPVSQSELSYKFTIELGNGISLDNVMFTIEKIAVSLGMRAHDDEEEIRKA